MNNFKYFRSNITMIVVLVLLCIAGCKKNETVEEVTTQDAGRIVYVPKDWASMNLNSATSTWSYSRSRQSDHFVVFWGAGYGTNDPNAAAIAATYRVDIDNLLTKAEEFYDVNVNKLKFADVGKGTSKLDKHKIIILLYYTAGFVGTGSGVDEEAGLLSLSPVTCQPVASTVAHEIAHTFQYLVNADLKGTSGFRHGYGGTGGNTFWEQSAQWQSFQSYPDEAFNAVQFNVFMQYYHKHFLHESQRYATYFMQYYWADKHGLDIIAKLWRQSRAPEDPLHTYMRLNKLNVEQLNDELYDAYKKFVTWDVENIRARGAAYIGRYTYGFTSIGNNTFRVAYNNCPQTTGFNVIPLTLPAAGTVISVDFKGVPNTSGFNLVDQSIAGWRYGYVGLLNDGTRIYSDMLKGTINTATFTVPQNCSKLWFVVTGAPTAYTSTAWDEIASNDEQWPYEVKFTNTKITGY
jgi:hypothetical protein